MRKLNFTPLKFKHISSVPNGNVKCLNEECYVARNESFPVSPMEIPEPHDCAIPLIPWARCKYKYSVNSLTPIHVGLHFLPNIICSLSLYLILINEFQN